MQRTVAGLVTHDFTELLHRHMWLFWDICLPLWRIMFGHVTISGSPGILTDVTYTGADPKYMNLVAQPYKLSD